MQGVWGLRKNGVDKVIAINCEADPPLFGRKMISWCNDESINRLNDYFDKIELVHTGSYPWGEELDWIKQMKETLVHYFDPELDMNWDFVLFTLRNNPYILTHFILNSGKAYMVDDSEMLENSSKCHYGYIINLDTERLEFWIGHQIKPNSDRYQKKYSNGLYRTYASDNGEFDYYACKLVVEFPLVAIKRSMTGCSTWMDEVSKVMRFT